MSILFLREKVKRKGYLNSFQKNYKKNQTINEERKGRRSKSKDKKRKKMGIKLF